MDFSGKERSYKCFGAEGYKIRNFDFQSHVFFGTDNIRMDNIVTLSYLIKMGGTQNKLLTLLSKEIWQYLITKGVTITTKYLPGSLNKEMDSQSVKDSRKWKLNLGIFQIIIKQRRTLDVDLFVSRVSQQDPA